MRDIRNLSRIKSIIRHSGIIVKNSPTVDHPIPVAVFYLNKADGTVGGFWPKGNRQTALSACYRSGSRMLKLTLGIYSLCFALRLESVLAHGKFVVYTDLPTATYLQQQWHAE